MSTLSLSSINEHLKLKKISHSAHQNPNPFGIKKEEAPIYISTKPYFIPLEFIEITCYSWVCGKP
jgi:hypothetical protein